MMKVRISKIGNDFDDVRVTHFPWHKKLEDETDEDFMNRLTIGHEHHGNGKWKNNPHVDIDLIELPDRSIRDQWYPDLEENGEPYIKVDQDWSIKLMKPRIIRRKHLARLNAKIDAELDANITDPSNMMRLSREKEKSSDWTDKDWYEQALANMDEDGLDKPTIRTKLQSKIQELAV